MKVKFKYLAEFQRLAKDLKKKYKSFKDDYDTFLDELEREPFSGEPLGHNRSSFVSLSAHISSILLYFFINNNSGCSSSSTNLSTIVQGLWVA